MSKAPLIICIALFQVCSAIAQVPRLKAVDGVRSQRVSAEMLQPKSLTKEVYVLFPHSQDAQKITVAVGQDGSLTYQEDILIDTAQVIYDTSGRGTRTVDLMLRMRREAKKRVTTFSATQALWFGWGVWEEGRIPYTIKTDMPQKFRELIAQAIDHINRSTNLCIYLRENDESDYIEFIPVENQAFSGRSPLGKKGGRQILELDVLDPKRGEASFRTVVHELLHAAGFIHEQSRSDRDEYVEILFDNIDPDLSYNFNKDIFSNNRTAYDFKSVMHYGSKSFNIDDKVTIKPRDSRNKIEPSRELTALDIEGVNALYTTNADCSNRTKKIRSAIINGTDGKMGELVYDKIVSAGWNDAAPVKINGITQFMMFLNYKTTFAEVRELNSAGGFVRQPAYSKDWGLGWRNIEMLYMNNTTYILHQKQFPGFENLTTLPHGFTRISKVNAAAPFGNNNLGSVVYEESWGAGWSVIRFFEAGNNPYLFRMNARTNQAQIFKINKNNPFANGSLGTLVYDKTWTEGWTEVRFFEFNDKVYCFHLKSQSGQVRISEISNTDPFGTGNLGPVRYEGDWESGWTNINIFTNSNGKTYLFREKEAQGTAQMLEFKSGDAFINSSPFTVVETENWSSGWSHTEIYRSANGYRLLHMKE